jgi:hypothetical protein
MSQLYQTFSYVRPEDLLVRVSLVSKSFRGFATDDHLWRVPFLTFHLLPVMLITSFQRLSLARWGESVLKETEGGRNTDDSSKSCRRKVMHTRPLPNVYLPFISIFKILLCRCSGGGSTGGAVSWNATGGVANAGTHYPPPRTRRLLSDALVDK